MVVQGNLKGVLSLKEVSQKFQGSFKGVNREFRESFKEV